MTHPQDDVEDAIIIGEYAITSQYTGMLTGDTIISRDVLQTLITAASEVVALRERVKWLADAYCTVCGTVRADNKIINDLHEETARLKADVEGLRKALVMFMTVKNDNGCTQFEAEKAAQEALNALGEK